MSRIVCVGTEQEPYIVRQDEIEPHLQGSHFEHARFDRLDLNVGLDNCDFIRCEVIDCDLSNASVDWLVSRRTSWAGSKLSTKFNTRTLVSCHDVVSEFLTQGLPSAGGRIAQTMQAARDYITSSYRTSWPDTAFELVERRGFTVEEIIEASELGFGHVSHFMRPWRYCLARPHVWLPKPAVMPRRFRINGLAPEPERADLLAAINLRTGNRGLLKERAERFLEARYRKLGPWHVQVFQADEWGIWVEAWNDRGLNPDSLDYWDFWRRPPPEALVAP